MPDADDGRMLTCEHLDEWKTWALLIEVDPWPEIGGSDRRFTSDRRLTDDQALVGPNDEQST